MFYLILVGGASGVNPNLFYLPPFELRKNLAYGRYGKKFYPKANWHRRAQKTAKNLKGRQKL